jgi:hypothetical protein
LAVRNKRWPRSWLEAGWLAWQFHF